MDKSAIEQIQLAAAIEQVSESVNSAFIDKAPGETPVVFLPDNFTGHDLESYLPGRVRFRGRFETFSIGDFLMYCKDNTKAGTACFVNAIGMDVEAIFDLGDTENPGHAVHRGTLTLQKTAEFKALLKIDGNRLSQKGLAEWMEDWADGIHCYTADGEHLDIKKAISAVRRITIDQARTTTTEEQQYRAQQSALESIEAKSDEVTPAGFRFECVPYDGMSDRSFDVRLSIGTGDDRPTLTARIRQMEKHQQDMGAELVDAIGAGLGGGKVSIYAGEFSA